MPSRHAAVALAAVAALGLSTGCEKQSPYVTLTAHGVTVKARAVKYCRGTECDTSTDVAKITVRDGDTLGIDVPRSLAAQGWRIGDQGDFSHDHYRSIPITSQFQPGAELPVQIVRDDKHGAGEWRFTVVVK
ncbi:MAG: hypothetical protein QOE45_202 [Frankiaceae bacterium]|jgi:hypothetical protein|nr:hypothetical protein [Frankiaceae bacterium]